MAFNTTGKTCNRHAGPLQPHTEVTLLDAEIAVRAREDNRFKEKMSVVSEKHIRYILEYLIARNN